MVHFRCDAVFGRIYVPPCLSSSVKEPYLIDGWDQSLCWYEGDLSQVIAAILIELRGFPK
jgi:hypothetical protein